jgi:hypothetical protein
MIIIKSQTQNPKPIIKMRKRRESSGWGRRREEKVRGCGDVQLQVRMATGWWRV